MEVEPAFDAHRIFEQVHNYSKENNIDLTREMVLDAFRAPTDESTDADMSISEDEDDMEDDAVTETAAENTSIGDSSVFWLSLPQHEIVAHLNAIDDSDANAPPKGTGKLIGCVHYNNDLGKYIYLDVNGTGTCVTRGMLLAMKDGFVLRRWTKAGRSTFYHWIVCNAIDKLPVEDDKWLQYKLLAVRNMNVTVSQSKGHRPVPCYTLAYRNLNNVVMEPKKVDNVVGIFNLPVPPPGYCKCGNIRDNFSATYICWQFLCSRCNVRKNAERRAENLHDTTTIAKNFAERAVRKDEDDGATEIMPKIDMVAYLLPQIKLARRLYGDTAILSKERRVKGSYSENIRQGQLIVCPFRFNIGANVAKDHRGKVDGKSWSLSMFILCCVMQKYGLNIRFPHLDNCQFRSAQAHMLGNMATNAKSRIKKWNEIHPDEKVVFEKDLDLVKKLYASQNCCISGLPLTYQMGNGNGTTHIQEADAVEDIINAAFKQTTGFDMGPPDTPLHQLLKMSPERLDNKILNYTDDNTIPVNCAFQTPDHDATLPELVLLRSQQKWQRSTFLSSDFSNVAVHFGLIANVTLFNKVCDVAFPMLSTVTFDQTPFPSAALLTAPAELMNLHRRNIAVGITKLRKTKSKRTPNNLYLIVNRTLGNSLYQTGRRPMSGVKKTQTETVAAILLEEYNIEPAPVRQLYKEACDRLNAENVS